MGLFPYGFLNEGMKDRLDEDGFTFGDPHRKIDTFKESQEKYNAILDSWFEDMKNNIWPIYKGRDNWEGEASNYSIDGTEQELKICIQEFQKKDILSQPPKIKDSYPNTEYRDHLWHYRVEDAKFSRTPKNSNFESQASIGPGSNFFGYTTGIDVKNFHNEFWYNNRSRQPSFLAIKLLFQRPRPWTTASFYSMTDFQWHTGSPITHTGVHPAFPSGHCYQGIIHSAHVYQNWIYRGRTNSREERKMIKALKQYAVDFGDRRVFAGVHYPTDNIASWILALRVAPYMFDDEKLITEFIISAVTKYSHVYKAIQKNFSKSKNLRPALEILNAEFPQPSL